MQCATSAPHYGTAHKDFPGEKANQRLDCWWSNASAGHRPRHPFVTQRDERVSNSGREVCDTTVAVPTAADRSHPAWSSPIGDTQEVQETVRSPPKPSNPLRPTTPAGATPRTARSAYPSPACCCTRRTALAPVLPAQNPALL